MAKVIGTQQTAVSQYVRLTSKKASRQSNVSSADFDIDERSIVNKLTAKIQNDPPIRMDLVNRVKAQIAAGTYETPERIEGTVNKLLEELYPELLE